MPKILWMAFLVFLITCKQHVKPPPGLINKDRMVGFLIELHVLEGSVQQLRIPKDSADLVFTHFEKKLFAKHGFTDSSYLKSLDYYNQNPQLLEEIYAAVLDSLGLYDRVQSGKEQ